VLSLVAGSPTAGPQISGLQGPDKTRYTLINRRRSTKVFTKKILVSVKHRKVQCLVPGREKILFQTDRRLTAFL
jgi:hypothetical protein